VAYNFLVRVVLWMSLVLLAVGARGLDAQEKSKKDRAEEFFERIRFVKSEFRDDEQRRLVELLKKKEHWIGAYRALEKFGKFPDDQELTVEFDHAGEELGVARCRGVQGQIRFNVNRMAQGQKILDDLERQRKVFEAQGTKLVYLIPPFHFDRVIYHEMTHILQRSYDAPDWFNEGMAELVSGEPHSLLSLALSGRRIKDIEDPLSKPLDVYGRGLLFWKWLSDRGSAEKAIQLSIIERKPWKEALEGATKLPWSVIVPSEHDWSGREAESRR
jgi:hypothetical protein